MGHESLKALVVDDSMAMRIVLLDILERIGFNRSNVTEAVDGVDALEKAKAATYDIILMDWNMPNKNGLEALKELRESGDKTPLMMVTTEGERAHVVEAIKAGANNYLVKPFNSTDLSEKIEQLLASIQA